MLQANPLSCQSEVLRATVSAGVFRNRALFPTNWEMQLGFFGAQCRQIQSISKFNLQDLFS